MTNTVPIAQRAWHDSGVRDTPTDRKALTELSRFLSFVLRHAPESIGVALDDHGWAIRVPEPKLEYFDAEQTARWLIECQRSEPTWYSLFFAGFRTGLREGELFALRVEDLDLDARQVHVRHTYGAAALPDEGTGRAVPTYVEGTPKNGKGRVVGIASDLDVVLRAHIGTRRTGLVWSVRPRDDGDAHVRVSNIRGPWERVAAAARLPQYGIHAMRHSFASQLAMGGVPLAHVQALLGHSTIAMTERYAHFAPGFASGAVDVLVTPLVTPRASDLNNAGPRPGKVVGVTG